MAYSVPLQEHLNAAKMIEEDILKDLKPTILLTSYQRLISNENIFSIGQWLLKQKVQYNSKQKKLIYKSLPITYQKVYFDRIQVISVRKYRVIAFNLWQEKQSDEHIEKILLLRTIFNCLNKCQKQNSQYVKLFCLRKSTDTSKQDFLKTIQSIIIGPFKTIIYLNDSPQETQRDDIVLEKTQNCLKPYDGSIQEIFDIRGYSEEISIKLNINEKVKNSLNKLYLSIEQAITQLIVSIFNIARETQSQNEQMTRSIHYKKESQFNTEATLEKFIEKYKITEMSEKSILSYFKSIKNDYVHDYRYEEFRAETNFVHFHLLCEINTMYDYFCKNENLQTLQKVLFDMICLLHDLAPCLENRQRFKYLPQIQVFLVMMMKEVEKLVNLGTADFLIKLMHKLYKNFCPNPESIFSQILNYTPKQNQSQLYYQSYLYLLEQNEKKCKFSSTQMPEMMNKKAFIQMRLRFLKASNSHKIDIRNKKQIIKNIQDLYYIYKHKYQIEQKDRKKFKFNDILKRCASLSRILIRPDIAFLIYKKLKYVYLAQDSFLQILLQKTEQQKAKLYYQFSEYLYSIAFEDMALKYCQLAYENDENYLEKMTELKLKIMKKEHSKTQLAEIQACKKNHTFDEYFSSKDDQLNSFLDNLWKQEEEQPEKYIRLYCRGSITTDFKKIF